MSEDISSSSNPFRRKLPAAIQTTKEDDNGTSATVRDQAIPLNQGTVKPSKGKRVRITSPPTTSPAQQSSFSISTYSVHGEGNSNVSPSSSVSDTEALDPIESSPIDPFERFSVMEDQPVEDELVRDTEETAQGTTLSSSFPKIPKAPANPFQSTLTTLEEPYKGNAGEMDKTPTLRPTLAGRTGSSSAKGSLDVESFTRLLMTGKVNSPDTGDVSAGAAVQQHLHAGLPGDNSSSTDTSSISRQSIFEPTPDMRDETPRTSHDISPLDEEQQRLVNDTLPSAARKKPPPPKRRHGKLIKSNIPQTVSFTDPAVSTPLVETTSSTPPYQVRPISSNSMRSPTDLNKPLPPPPLSTSPDAPPMPVRLVHAHPEESSSSPSQRRRPPTLPLARRHSQLRTSKPLLPRNNSTKSFTPLEETSPNAFISGPSEPQISPISKPPPPPRIRRQDLAQSHSLSDLPTLPDKVLASPSIPMDQDQDLAFAHPSPALPPPPTRTPSMSSVKPRSRSSPSSAKAGMPPPPPPPRQRGSSRSSVESNRPIFSQAPNPTRTSGELRRTSTESQRRPSGASPGRALGSAEDRNEPAANDILADLSALQREVDELRGKYEGRKPS
ncbi:MAG: hypothetical protein M1827_001736 [Pycnora praestabilis]|nr:MAG: hypothetical protein M1827_001736 [Pycnora praestabilis]